MATDVPTAYIRLLQDKLTEKGVPKLYTIASIQNWGGQMRKVEYADAYAEFPPNIGEDRWRSHAYTKWKHTDDHHLGLTVNFDNTPR